MIEGFIFEGFGEGLRSRDRVAGGIDTSSYVGARSGKSFATLIRL
jgi:hypothetical protein